MLQMIAARASAKRKAKENDPALKNHQALGARRNSLWRREADGSVWGTQGGAPSSEAMRDRLDRVYENYYNYNPGGDDEDAAAQPATSESVTVGGENFGKGVGKLTKAISSKMRPIFFFGKSTQVSHFDDEDFVVQDGHLPIWVIARLKIKLERARHAIMARHELVRPKHAIKPEGGFKILWDLITTLLLVYTLFEIPLEIAFIEAGCVMSSLDWFNFIVDIIFCLDIGVAFHTGFVIKINGEDILQDNHWLIAERYFRGWFCVDLVSSIPLERFVCLAIDTSGGSEGGGNMDALRVFKMARFLKLARLIRFNRMLNKWQAMSVKKWQLNFTRLFKLIIFLLGVAHFMGCGWKILEETIDCGVWVDPVKHGGLGEKDLFARYGCECLASVNGSDICEPVNWIAKYDMQLYQHGNLGQQYVTAAYFTIISLSTVGFGDINPSNDFERLFSIILTLAGAVVFAIVLGSVSEIAQQRNHFEVALSNTVHTISDFLEHRNVPEDVANRVIKHITFASQKAPHQYAPDQMNLLPPVLRQQLTQQLVNEQLGTVVQTYPLFVNMDPELRINFLLLLRPVMLLHEEYLYEALDIGREAYILTSGQLEIFIYENQFGHMAKCDERIKDVGEFVGETALLEEGPPYRYNSIRGFGSGIELLQLTKEDLDIHIRFAYPDVYKCIQEMARARLTAPGSKEALMAMRSRSIRRCAIIKQKTRKDPLTGKPLFGDEEPSVFDENKSKDKTFKENHTHNSSMRKSSKLTEDPAPAEAVTSGNVPCLKPADSQLEARMDKLESAMRNLTDLMIKMNDKIDQNSNTTMAGKHQSYDTAAQRKFFP